MVFIHANKLTHSRTFTSKASSSQAKQPRAHESQCGRLRNRVEIKCCRQPIIEEGNVYIFCSVIAVDRRDVRKTRKRLSLFNSGIRVEPVVMLEYRLFLIELPNSQEYTYLQEIRKVRRPCRMVALTVGVSVAFQQLNSLRHPARQREKCKYFSVSKFFRMLALEEGDVEESAGEYTGERVEARTIHIVIVKRNSWP